MTNMMVETKLLDKIDALTEALIHEESIGILYNTENKKTVREIVPKEFCDGHNLMAFCNLRNQMRKFSIEKIEYVYRIH